MQYVPQFRGKVFVVVIDSPASALAETMLDLVSLQSIGVQLVVASTAHSNDDLLDLAAEAELKFGQVRFTPSSPIEDVVSTLERGQVVFCDLAGQGAFSGSWLTWLAKIGANKLIHLHSEERAFAQGAVSVAEAAAIESLSPAVAACSAGVPRVHLLDGHDPAVMLGELFSNEGVGTMIYADAYRSIRPLREDDIVELLGMIGRSVRNSHLVPRGYADIENRLEDYFVMDIDGNVVGCIALHSYLNSEMAEVACLYVKQAHEGMGYGVELVRYAEDQAKKAGVASVFALTNRAAD
ncbi:MAG: GNAT family N-acetyltransferase, partial [Akkermansiaceae bacterium]